MNLKDKNIVFGLTGSFCMFKNTIIQMKELVKAGANILPIMSYTAYKMSKSKNIINEIEEITGREVIHTIKKAHQTSYKNLTDVLIIAPCTGNTLSKICNGICDSPVLVATQINLRNNIPIVLGINVLDGLSTNAENIGKLLNKKNCFFVPFRQSNPITKPNYLSLDPKYIINTLEYALNREQIQPIIL